MSIISMLEADRSGAICKAYADLTVAYLEHGGLDVASKESAQVPLANLFRLLEMYKYEAFSDERPNAVLAVDTDISDGFSADASPWHVAIRLALDAAAEHAFKNVARENLVEELQQTLRGLVGQGQVVASPRSVDFFKTLSAQLAH